VSAEDIFSVRDGDEELSEEETEWSLDGGEESVGVRSAANASRRADS